MSKKKIVVVGGGTGTHTVLRGLKRFQDIYELSAVVTMADSGGSTGRLRDEFGCLPVGDVRMALAALASDVDHHEELLRELFLYRFAKGEGLSGHNFGNLFLTALTDILGTEEAAIAAASRVLRVRGNVLPVTTAKVQLEATYFDGVVLTGEHTIDEPTVDRHDQRITKLAVTPTAKISARAKDALLNADMVVLGPGDLYTSVLANIVVDGVKEAIQESPATLVYVCNLMTKAGQTTGMGVKEHVAEITAYVGKSPNLVCVNNAALPVELLKRYEQEKEYPVQHNFDSTDTTYTAADLLTDEEVRTANGDVLKRSLIRHDPHKLAQVLQKIL